MARRPPPIPAWPRVEATVHADGTATLTVDGVARGVLPEGAKDVRRAVIGIVERELAADLGRPVRLRVRDPEGEGVLAVHPDRPPEELEYTWASAATRRAAASARAGAFSEQPARSPTARGARAVLPRRRVRLRLVAGLAGAVLLVGAFGVATVRQFGDEDSAGSAPSAAAPTVEAQGAGEDGSASAVADDAGAETATSADQAAARAASARAQAHARAMARHRAATARERAAAGERAAEARRRAAVGAAAAQEPEPSSPAAPVGDGAGGPAEASAPVVPESEYAEASPPPPAPDPAPALWGVGPGVTPTVVAAHPSSPPPLVVAP